MKPVVSHSLTIRNVSKHYGPVVALDRVSLEVLRGEFITFLGPSGSGKTTLLMTIAGFTEPTEGDVLVDGAPVTHLLPEKRNFGMVFQGYALFPHMTVAENVGFPLNIRGLPKSECDVRVREILETVQLGHLNDRKPKQLSGGQQQRVALARALVFEPGMLLLDEPLSALDKKLRKDLQYELKELHNRIGRTFIYVTHDQDEALSMSDRIAIVHEGQIAQIGAPDELYHKPKSVFVADFLGKSNFLRGKVAAREGDVVVYRSGDKVFRQAVGQYGPAEGQDIVIAIRPEKMKLVNSENELGDGDLNVVAGRIVGWNFFGSTFEIRVATDHLGDLTVSTSAWQNSVMPDYEKPVWVSWSPDASVIVEDH